MRVWQIYLDSVRVTFVTHMGAASLIAFFLGASANMQSSYLNGVDSSSTRRLETRLNSLIVLRKMLSRIFTKYLRTVST